MAMEGAFFFRKMVGTTGVRFLIAIAMFMMSPLIRMILMLFTLLDLNLPRGARVIAVNIGRAFQDLTSSGGIV